MHRGGRTGRGSNSAPATLPGSFCTCSTEHHCAMEAEEAGIFVLVCQAGMSQAVRYTMLDCQEQIWIKTFPACWPLPRAELHTLPRLKTSH